MNFGQEWCLRFLAIAEQVNRMTAIALPDLKGSGKL